MMTETGYIVIKEEFPSLELKDPDGAISNGEEFWDLCFKLYKEAGYGNSVTVKVHGVAPNIKSEYNYS